MKDMRDTKFDVVASIANVEEGRGILLVIGKKRLYITEQNVPGLDFKPVLVGEASEIATETAMEIKGLRTIISSPNELLKHIVKFFATSEGHFMTDEEVESRFNLEEKETA